jgi:hypothetical protein
MPPSRAVVSSDAAPTQNQSLNTFLSASSGIVHRQKGTFLCLRHPPLLAHFSHLYQQVLASWCRSAPGLSKFKAADRRSILQTRCVSLLPLKRLLLLHHCIASRFSLLAAAAVAAASLCRVSLLPPLQWRSSGLSHSCHRYSGAPRCCLTRATATVALLSSLASYSTSCT